MSKLTRTLIGAFLLAAPAAFCSLAAAQSASGVTRYVPATPTVSPYLNLLRNNSSGVPNYYSFVRPQQLQRQFNAQEQTLLRRQSEELIRIGNEIQTDRTATAATGTGGWFMNAGTRNTYLNTTRYYPTPVLRR